MARAFIGVGSNIEPEANLRRALHRLERVGRVTAISTVYRTEPVGRTSQPQFYNAVIEIATEVPPVALKRELRRIEEDLGRRRTADKYAPRTIDLDLILYDDLVVTADGLTLPDPQIRERPFLAIPLCEVAPDLVLPDSGEPIRQVAAALAQHTMEPLAEYTALLRKDVTHG
jgi:dihydroneopterin aldolase/2-amino-4-hydroxy-6-hydroxymethyldihydropteridine diphosphokinase